MPLVQRPANTITTFTSATASASTYYTRAQAAVPATELRTRTLHSSVTIAAFWPFCCFSPSAPSIQHFPHPTLSSSHFHCTSMRIYIQSDRLPEYMHYSTEDADTAVFPDSRLTGRNVLSRIHIYITLVQQHEQSAAPVRHVCPHLYAL